MEHLHRAPYFFCLRTPSLMVVPRRVDERPVCLRHNRGHPLQFFEEPLPRQYLLEASVTAGGAHEVEHVRAEGFAVRPSRPNSSEPGKLSEFSQV